jgi:hypothetical protein
MEVVRPLARGAAGDRVMITIILYILLVIFLILVLALLLPVKIYFSAAGAEDTGIRANGRIMLFAGLLGGGGLYGPDGPKISIWLGGWRILERSAAPIVRRVRKKELASEKNKPEKPEKERKEAGERKLSLSERIEEGKRMARKYSFLVKTALHEMRGLLRVNHFVARVKFGLGDPALTGQIIGIIYAINGILPERYVIVPAWDFSRRVFSGEVDLKLTFRTYLFWIHLFRGVFSYLRFRRKQRPVPGDDLKAQEV